MSVTLIIAAVTTLLDIAAKRAATQLLSMGSVVVLPGVLELRLTHNDGMALGILSGNMAAIVVFPLVVIACGFLLLRKYECTRFIGIASGLVLGGFLGNFIQRLLLGYVVDMIYLPFMPWFVCNVADIAICVGVFMFGISLLFRPKDWREKHAKDQSGSAD